MSLGEKTKKIALKVINRVDDTSPGKLVIISLPDTALKMDSPMSCNPGTLERGQRDAENEWGFIPSYDFIFIFIKEGEETAGGRRITQRADIYCRKERKKLDYVNTLKG